MKFYASQPEWTYYEPFGKLWDNANSEPDPRYTDHEYDMQTGYNYMKGRYQLPNCGRFNRPDPMRDWDWENPASINLYQYVRNSPIEGWDPDGLEVNITGVREGEKRIFTIIYTGVLINNSDENFSEEQLKEFAAKIEEQFSQAYQGGQDDVEFKAEAHITVVSSEDEISEKDHVIRIVSDIVVKDKPGEHVGLAGTNEK